jgi:6-phosphogluconate dehydrogenase (decarboxylating)
LKLLLERLRRAEGAGKREREAQEESSFFMESALKNGSGTRIWLLKLAEISLRKNAQNGKFYAKFGKSSKEGNAMDQAFPVESITANCANFFASAASFIFRSSLRRSRAVFLFSGI